MQSDGIESEVNNLLEAFSDLNNEELKEMLEGDPAKLNAKLNDLVNNSSMVRLLEEPKLFRILKRLLVID